MPYKCNYRRGEASKERFRHKRAFSSRLYPGGEKGDETSDERREEGALAAIIGRIFSSSFLHGCLGNAERKMMKEGKGNPLRLPISCCQGNRSRKGRKKKSVPRLFFNWTFQYPFFGLSVYPISGRYFSSRIPSFSSPLPHTQSDYSGLGRKRDKTFFHPGSRRKETFRPSLYLEKNY